MKHFELLPPNLWIEDLKTWQFELRQALNKLQKQISEEKQEIKGHLRISATKSGPQYYHIKEKGDTRGIYIPRDMETFAEELAQKDYNIKIAKDLEEEIKLLNKFLEKYKAADPQAELEKLNEIRRQLITPVTLPAKDFASEWKKIKYIGKQMNTEGKVLLTSCGEKVRSKSEVIIADTLARYKVPYRYEYPVKVRDYVLYPDFCCLNVRTRQEYIWEHLGMLDNPEYAEMTVQKIQAYQSSGYIIGKKLLLTMETGNIPLEQRQITAVIKEYLV